MYAPSSRELDLAMEFDVVIHAAINMNDMNQSAHMLVIDFSNRTSDKCLLVYVSSWVTLDTSVFSFELLCTTQAMGRINGEPRRAQICDDTPIARDRT